jgi:hypothetical protein
VVGNRSSFSSFVERILLCRSLSASWEIEYRARLVTICSLVVLEKDRVLNCAVRGKALEVEVEWGDEGIIVSRGEIGIEGFGT